MSKLCKRQALMDAADLGLLHYGQVDPLLHFLEERLARHKAAKARFGSARLLFSLGCMLTIGACALLGVIVVRKWGIPVLLDLSLIYILFTLTLAVWLDMRGKPAAASVFAVTMVALVPVAMYALQQVMGFWNETPNAALYRDVHHWMDWRWLLIEMAALSAGSITLWRFKYGVLVVPVAVAAFYMGMDIVPALLMQGSDAGLFSPAGWELRQRISVAYGVLVLAMALVVDVRSRRTVDYAFWLYLCGLTALFGGLASMDGGGAGGKLFYLALSIAFIVAGAVLGRRMFAVFGAAGAAAALASLSWSLYRDSFALAGIAVLLALALAIGTLWWRKNEHWMHAKLHALLPRSLQANLMVRG